MQISFTSSVLDQEDCCTICRSDIAPGENVVSHDGWHPLHHSCFIELLINGKYSACIQCGAAFDLREARVNHLTWRQRVYSYLPPIKRIAGLVLNVATLPLITQHWSGLLELTCRSSDGSWNEPLLVLSNSFLSGFVVSKVTETFLTIYASMNPDLLPVVQKVYLASTATIFCSFGMLSSVVCGGKPHHVESLVLCSSIAFGALMCGLTAKRFYRSLR